MEYQKIIELVLLRMGEEEEELKQCIYLLELSRFWVQRVLVPILVSVGVVGNLITVIILTRKRMRCSTNVYLTALAIADLIYLVFALLLSFKHYPNSHDIAYEFYWKLIGFIHWLVDSSNYISIWLTVSFTVERYIAVCHPIRGKILCTENRAKRVIAAVCAVCLITTVTTNFEYKMSYRRVPIDYNNTNLTSGTIIAVNESHSLASLNSSTPDLFESSNEFYKTVIKLEYSELALDGSYTTIFYWYTAIVFTFVPLVLLITFNTFLINAVHTSQKMRYQMTNSSERSSTTQENRITITLIAVVILFLMCQIPGALALLYTVFKNMPMPNSCEDYYYRVLGNIFNFLVNLNAACNFLLYCALSDKYRRTFRAVFMNGRRRTNSSKRGDSLFTNSMSMSHRYRAPSTTVSSLRNTELKRHLSTQRSSNFEIDRSGKLSRTKSLMVPRTNEVNV